MTTDTPVTTDAERRMPPVARGTVELLRCMGHQVTVRINRSGSHRYRLDGGRELTAQKLETRRRRLAGETVGRAAAQYTGRSGRPEQDHARPHFDARV